MSLRVWIQSGLTMSARSDAERTRLRGRRGGPGRAARVTGDHAAAGNGAGGFSGGLFGEAGGSFAGSTGFGGFDAKTCGGAGGAPPAPPTVDAVSPFANTPGPTLSPSYEVKTDNWTFEAERQPGQLTFRGAYNVGPLQLGAVFRLFFTNLSFSGTDTIADGVERPSGIHLDGIDRISVGFAGGSGGTAEDNIRARIDIPINLEVLTRQLSIYGIPMVLAFKPKFIIETAFSARNSTLWTCGDYNLNLEPLGPAESPVVKFFKVTKSLLPINGISIGVNGVALAFDLKAMFGPGLKLAYAGPFYDITVAAGITRGSDIGLVTCQGADFVISQKAGVGFSVGGESLGWLTSILDKAIPGKNALVAIANKLAPGKQSIEFGQTLYAGNLYGPKHQVIPNIPLCGS
jgi:hypothetical protein